MKKFVATMSLVLVLIMTIVLSACGPSLPGTYYLYEKGSLNKTQYIELDGKTWKSNTNDSGTYETNDDQITLYIEFFGYKTVYSKGTFKKGVLFLSNKTYCQEGYLPFETEEYRGEENDQESGLKFVKQKDGYMVTGPISRDIEKAIIPETFKGKPVTAIAKMAFYDCAKLKEFKIPSSVISIGVDAFYGTFGSEYTDDPTQWFGLRTIDDCAVQSRETIGFPDGTKPGTRLIADGACSRCNMKGREGIIISNSVRYIGNDLFGDQDASDFHILFDGTKEEWNKISIGSNNDDWNKKENIYFYSKEKPTDEGNYWYRSGEREYPKIWKE